MTDFDVLLQLHITTLNQKWKYEIKIFWKKKVSKAPNIDHGDLR